MSDAVLDFQPDTQEFDFQPEAAPALRPEDQAKIDQAIRTVPLPRPDYMQTEQTLTAPIAQRPTPVSPTAQQYEADLARANQVKPTLSGVAGTAAEAFTAPTGGAVPTEPGEGANVSRGVQELQTPGTRARGAGRLALSTLNAATPLIGPAVLDADTLPKALGQAFGFGEGYVGGKAAKKVTKVAGGGEEAQNIAEGIGQLSPVVAHAALRPEIGVRTAETSPTGDTTSVSAGMRGAGAGVAVTPEAVTVRGKVGPFEASKTFTRGAKPAEKPALTPQTIEGELAKNPATRDEIADAQAATNYAGPEQAKAAVVEKRQAAAAAVEGAATEKPPAVAAPPESDVTNVTERPRMSANVTTPKPEAPQTSAPPVIGEPIAKPRTNGQPLEHGFDFRPAEDVGQQARDAVQKDQGALPRGERRKLERTPEEQQTQTLFGQARKELGEDATSDQVMARVEELKKAPVDFKADQFKHRSTQVNIPEDSEAHQALETTRARISDSDLAAKGKDVGGNHVTVRWGLQAPDDDKLEKLKQYLSSVPPFEAKLGKTEKFEPSESSDGAAVIQSPVEAPEMKQIHDELAKHGDFTEPTFDKYVPHATIAYVKPAVADRYVGMSPTHGKTFRVESIAITDRNGRQKEVPLQGNNASTTTELGTGSASTPIGGKSGRRVPDNGSDSVTAKGARHGDLGKRSEGNVDGAPIGVRSEGGADSSGARRTPQVPPRSMSELETPGSAAGSGPRLPSQPPSQAVRERSSVQPEGHATGLERLHPVRDREDATLSSSGKEAGRDKILESELKQLKQQRADVMAQMLVTGSYGEKATELRTKHNDFLRKIQEREDELARLKGEPTRSEKRDLQTKEAEKSFAERPKEPLSYDDPKYSQHWQVLESDYIEKRFKDKAKTYERAITESKQEISESKSGTKKRSDALMNLEYRKSALEKFKAKDPRAAQSFKTEYNDLVKKAVSQGKPVPQAVIDQKPEFKLAQDARERYEKGRHTSFANKSAAINDTMQKEEGFKVKRQDGKPITDAQIKEISDGVSDVVKVLGEPLRDAMRGTDLTIAHTSGKHPFLSDAGGMYHPVDRTVSAGIEDFLGRPVKALAHELGHWFDFESGRAIGVRSRIYTKSGQSHVTQYQSESDSSKQLYELARRTMSDTREVSRMLKVTKLSDLPETERAEVERVKVVLGHYWREPRELFARMFEQYIADELGKPSTAAENIDRYYKTPAWWDKEAWAKLKPMMAQEIAKRFDALKERYAPSEVGSTKSSLPAPVEPTATLDAPKKGTSVTAKIGSETYYGKVTRHTPEGMVEVRPFDEDGVVLAGPKDVRPMTSEDADAMVDADYKKRQAEIAKENKIATPPTSDKPVAGVEKITPAEAQFDKDVKKRATALRSEIATLKEKTSAPAAYFQDSAKNTAARDERSRNIDRLSEAQKELDEIERAHPREVKPLDSSKLPDREKNKYGFQREYFTQSLQPVLDAWKAQLGTKFANAVKNGTKGVGAPTEFPERQVLVNIPGDGHFRVNNDPSVLDKVIRGAAKGFANPGVGKGLKPTTQRVSKEPSEPAKWSYLERMADEAHEGQTQEEKDAALETIENILGKTPLKTLPKPGTTVEYRGEQFYVNGWDSDYKKLVNLIPADSDTGKQVGKWIKDGMPKLTTAESAVMSDRVRDAQESASLYLLQHVADPPESPAKKSIVKELVTSESGAFIPSMLTPKRVKGLYSDFIDRVIDQKLDLGDKYRRVADHDPVIAKMLHEKDNAPRYFRDKAQSNVDQVTQGLSEPQIRLAAMLSDSDAREYLEENHPEQFEEAQSDPAVMSAVQTFKQYQQQLSALRINLGWHVRRDLSMVETESGEWEVIDRDGNAVETFKKPHDAQDYIEQEGKVLDHLKRTYPEHLREPLMGATGAGPNVTGGSYGGIRPPKPDKKQRLASGQYFYEHGAKDFSGYLQSFTQASHATLNKKIYDELTTTATPWKEGTAQPTEITYDGKNYYRPDVALSMRSGLGVNKVKNPLEYRAYDPAKDDKLLIKSFEDGWGTLTTGKPGIGIHDRWLAPKEVVDALDNYDKTRGYQETDSIRRFFQEQIVGLFGPTVHMLNIMRRLAHVVGTGAWDPRVWPYYQKLFFSQELRDRMAEGLQDEAIDALSKNGTYTNARDIGSLHSYFLGNLNPANWVRQTVGKFSKGLLFDPKFMGGFGGMDQKARVLAYDYLREEAGMGEEEAAKNVDDGFGNYNRASWTERMKRWAKVLLFPGWDFSSLKWFLRHPFKTALAPALATLAANLALNIAGKNKDQDKYDYGYLHYGDRKFRSSLFTESMAMHIAEPVLSAARSAIEGGNAQDIGSAAGEGAIRGGAGMAGNLRPEILIATALLSNRQYLGGSKEIWKSEDRNIPGKVFPNRALDKAVAFAAVKALPALNRFLDTNYDNVDLATGAGSVFGITNYKAGAEERLKANIAKSMGYSQTLSALAERDPEAAEKLASDPNKAVYLVFHNDLSQIGKDLAALDKQKEEIALAPDLSAEERKNAIGNLREERQQLLASADALNDALTAAKLEMKSQ